MRLDPLCERLEAAAAADDDERDWEVHAHAAQFARIKAVTPDDYDSAQQAFAAALDLQRALVGAEYRLRYPARIGAFSDHPEEDPTRWRGVVDIGVIST
jgi:hypothetical protein